MHSASSHHPAITVLHYRPQGGGCNLCFVSDVGALPPLKDPIPAFYPPQTSPNSAVSHFPSSSDRLLSFQPSHLLFWKSGDNCPSHTSARNRRDRAICPSGEQEKQFSWSFQVSKWENIPCCAGSNIQAYPRRPFLLLNLHFGSLVCVILTSRVKCHFAVVIRDAFGHNCSVPVFYCSFYLRGIKPFAQGKKWS